MIRKTNNLSFQSEHIWQDESPGHEPQLRGNSPHRGSFMTYRMGDGTPGCRLHGGYPSHDGSTESWVPDDTLPLPSPLVPNSACSNRHCVPDIHRAAAGVRFIARHTRLQEDSTKVKEDWKYVAMVLDRLFLWIFTLAVFVGTAAIILQAPSLYDDRISMGDAKTTIRGRGRQ